MSNPLIAAAANQKGGVGKTTVCRELGFYCARMGFKTLVIDADSQGNLTKSMTSDDTKGLYDALSGNEYRIREITDKLSLLPGESRLAGLEKSLLGEVDVYTRLSGCLGESTVEYDIILIDCPPSLGVLTINALAFAHYVIIPVYPALYSMQGTNDLLETVKKVRSGFNPGLDFLGIVVNRYDPRAHIVREITREIDNTFGELVFPSRLSKSSKVEEAIASQRGILSLSRCKIQEEVKKLGREVLRRLRLGVIYDEETETL